MSVDGQASLAAALEAKRFDEVRGTPESAWVDFKQAPYQFETDARRRLSERGKWELCKDVAAFANARGGCLVLGFKEDINPLRGVAVAGEPSPIPAVLIDVTHYKDVLQQSVYPPIPGVEFLWFEADDTDKGILLISVPPSDEVPHVLRRLVNEAGDELEAVGVPTRQDDRTVWYSAERIHHLLRNGMRLATSDTNASPGTRGAGSNQLADEAIQEVTTLLEWDDKALYFLQAIPTAGPTVLDGFYDDVKSALERPASLRSAGFNLRGLGGYVDVIAGALVVRRMEDAAARLERNGLLTVGVQADPEFLGWAINKTSNQDAMRINPIVLVELTFEFCRFVQDALKPRAPHATWEFHLRCTGFQSIGPVVLAPGAPRSGMYSVFPSDYATPSADVWDQWVHDNDDPARVAFELLAQFYSLFGLPESAIPYAEADRRIDAQQILAIG